MIPRPLFLVMFPVMWLGVTVLLGQMSGWARLARRHPDTSSTASRSFTWRAGRMGFVNYKSILNVDVCDDGLRLSLMKLFSLGSPPMFIPWAEVEGPRFEKYFFRKVFRFEVDGTDVMVYGDDIGQAILLAKQRVNA